MINNSEPNPDLTEDEQEEVRRRDRERLKKMTFYCTTHKCLRKFILEYFGDKSPERCCKCSNCLSNHENTDITVDAQKIMSCVARTGQRYGKKVICDVLRGSKNERLISAGLSRQSTYGIMADCTEKRLRDIIEHLCENGYMTAEGDEYPILRLTPKSRGVLTGSETLRMMLEIPQKRRLRRQKFGSVPCGRKAAHRSQGAAQEPRHAAERTGVCRFQRRNAYGYVPHKAENPGRIHGGLRSRSKKSHSLRGSVSRNHSGVFIS